MDSDHDAPAPRGALLFSEQQAAPSSPLPSPSMSFGRPPGFTTFTATAPDRGSFPLDHEGECKQVMQDYLRCMKSHKMDNGKCRHLSKQYLQCRMEKGLMEKDDMSNLGFQDEDLRKQQQQNADPSPSPASSERAV